MKTLFLDFDGVLNSDKSWNKYRPETWKHIDPDAMANLREILEAVPDLKIVISSTWRRMMTIDEFRKFLSKWGISEEVVIDYTPNGKHLSDDIRGHEIAGWLTLHPNVTKFVILDDDNDMDELMDNLIQTDHKIGLTEKDVKRVVDKLK